METPSRQQQGRNSSLPTAALPLTSPRGCRFQPGDVVEAPRPQDVASTRDRKWHQHKQNLFYRDLLAQVAPNLTSSEGTELKGAAERIVDIIMIDKGGHFCKDEKDRWVVMDRKAAVTKVQQGLRNYRIKANNGGWYRERKQKKAKAAATKKKANPKPTGPSKKRKEPTVVFCAKSGERSIHPYALSLISAVCNQATTMEALRVLDAPFLQEPLNDKDGESTKERTIRLQLRHRYVGACAQGMPPRSFSEKLLMLWGGSLNQQIIPPDGPAEEDMQKETPANDDSATTTGEQGEAMVARDDETKDAKVNLQNIQSTSEQGSMALSD